jgi:hypothetical protein
MNTYDISDADAATISQALALLEHRSDSSRRGAIRETRARFEPTCDTGERLVMTPKTVREHFDGGLQPAHQALLDAATDAAIEPLLYEDGVYRAWHEACVGVIEQLASPLTPSDVVPFRGAERDHAPA